MGLATPKRLDGMTPSHARARTQEKRVAERIGGALTRGSGSGNEKGDARLKGVVTIECKTTKARSFSVTPEILDKLEAATFGSGEIPILQVELELGKRKAIVMPDWALDLVLEAAKLRTLGEGK